MPCLLSLPLASIKNDVVGHIRPICDGACSPYVIPMLNHIMEGGHAPSDHFSKLLYVSL